MKVVVGEGGRIQRFGKPIPVSDARGESIGIERIDGSVNDALFDAIASLDQRGECGRYYEDVYSDLIQEGTITAHAVEVGDLKWTEIDDHDDLDRATQMFA
jgi:choline kinase